MQENLRKLAYLAVRKNYPKEDYLILSKVFHDPENATSDRAFVSLINPVPRNSSNFLVINKNAECGVYDKVTNVWVKFCSTGNKLEDHDNIYDGSLSLSVDWMKNVIDDCQTYSNILLHDGSVVTNSSSKIIIVALHNKGEKVFISHPIISYRFIKVAQSYFTAKYREDFFKNGFVDKRPIAPGDLLAGLKEQKTFDKTFSVYSFDNATKTMKVWWRLSGMKTAKLYPHSLTKEKYVDLCSQISMDNLNTSAMVAIHPHSTTKKKLYFCLTSPEDIQKLYEKYTKNKPDKHKTIKGLELRKQQIKWINTESPETKLYPNYFWAAAKRTLYYEFLEALN